MAVKTKQLGEKTSHMMLLKPPRPYTQTITSQTNTNPSLWLNAGAGGSARLKAGASLVSSVLKSVVLSFMWKPESLCDPNP